MLFFLIDDILLHFADVCNKVEQMWHCAVEILSFFFSGRTLGGRELKIWSNCSL